MQLSRSVIDLVDCQHNQRTRPNLWCPPEMIPSNREPVNSGLVLKFPTSCGIPEGPCPEGLCRAWREIFPKTGTRHEVPSGPQPTLSGQFSWVSPLPFLCLNKLCSWVRSRQNSCGGITNLLTGVILCSCLWGTGSNLCTCGWLARRIDGEKHWRRGLASQLLTSWNRNTESYFSAVLTKLAQDRVSQPWQLPEFPSQLRCPSPRPADLNFKKDGPKFRLLSELVLRGQFYVLFCHGC